MNGEELKELLSYTQTRIKLVNDNSMLLTEKQIKEQIIVIANEILAIIDNDVIK